uniref:Reverse transcriptase domain-containing protein n=1 Tax=Nicotiana tabacum TaxID=4097 RepID=A0A1S3XJN2_TOBAC|nr:PREDICTED: uncharacterized protein LOC107765869 [Nicotiana tabacum]
MNCLLTVVYGYNTIEKRTTLWENLKEVAQGINMSWLVTGDFNAVMAPQDRMFGNPVTYAETKDYVDSMAHLKLNIKIPFRFLNVWAKNDNFLPLLNNEDFKYISQKIEKTRAELINTQKQISNKCSDELVEMERQQLHNLEKWSMIEEQAMKHKSKAHWIRLGDSNTKYFIAIIKESKNTTSNQQAHHEKRPYLITPTKTGLLYKAWQVVKGDVVVAVKEFFSTGKMYKAVNCTAITLVPKTAHPATVKEYRPIAGCSVLYKIIAKILASRMQQMIADVICQAHAGFIPGRKIADNIILINELVKSYTRKQVSHRCTIKIDLQKAYDSVEWPFLEQVMFELGFPSQFITWIMECVHTVNYTIVINGEPTELFNAARGLRQGDLISPFLFAMAMEYLSRCLNELKEVKAFKYHPRCAKLGITDLSFADDLLMFTRGDIASVAAMQQCLLHFSAASSLKANMGKSCVYFGGVQHQDKETILASWDSTKETSLSSRVQLIQSIIFGVQSYWAQLFIIPAKFLSLIEAYCRSFVWSGTNTITRKALVAWERDVNIPRDSGKRLCSSFNIKAASILSGNTIWNGLSKVQKGDHRKLKYAGWPAEDGREDRAALRGGQHDEGEDLGGGKKVWTALLRKKRLLYPNCHRPKAKSEAKTAKAETEAIVVVYRANAEAAQVQTREREADAGALSSSSDDDDAESKSRSESGGNLD